MSQMPLLRVEQLTVRYGDRVALQDVDLDLERGLIHAIVGPSGCGKTTFLHCLNRLIELIPGSEVEGRILLDGANVRSLDPSSLRLRVGQIFQRPNPFPMSIRKNMEIALREHGVRNRRELQHRTTQALRDVGLWNEVSDRIETPALELSGGQQQRLCIARAIALEPDVLLMDEPCSSLDPIATEVIEQLARQLRDRYTVIIVTHNLAQARRLADRTSIFWNDRGRGVLIETGPTSQVFEQPRDRRALDYVRGTLG